MTVAVASRQRRRVVHTDISVLRSRQVAQRHGWTSETTASNELTTTTSTSDKEGEEGQKGTQTGGVLIYIPAPRTITGDQ